jgi:hypothetical protein
MSSGEEAAEDGGEISSGCSDEEAAQRVAHAQARAYFAGLSSFIDDSPGVFTPEDRIVLASMQERLDRAIVASLLQRKQQDIRNFFQPVGQPARQPTAPLAPLS